MPLSFRVCVSLSQVSKSMEDVSCGSLAYLTGPGCDRAGRVPSGSFTAQAKDVHLQVPSPLIHTREGTRSGYKGQMLEVTNETKSSVSTTRQNQNSNPCLLTTVLQQFQSLHNFSHFLTQNIFMQELWLWDLTSSQKYLFLFLF